MPESAPAPGMDALVEAATRAQAGLKGELADFVSVDGRLTLADFRAKYDGDVMVGCGTIMNTPDAAAAGDAFDRAAAGATSRRQRPRPSSASATRTGGARTTCSAASKT